MRADDVCVLWQSEEQIVKDIIDGLSDLLDVEVRVLRVSQLVSGFALRGLCGVEQRLDLEAKRGQIKRLKDPAISDLLQSSGALGA
jgi:hypothetical protein